MDLTSLVTWAALVAIIYAFIANRLLAFGGSFRTIVIELGARLLEDKAVPDEIKAWVRQSLHMAVSRRAAWLAAASVIPLTIAIRLETTKEERSRRRAFPKGMSKKPRFWDAWTAYGQALLLAILCNSPLALFLYYGQMAFVSWIVWPHMVMMRLILKGIEKHLGEHSLKDYHVDQSPALTP
jgi:hypothetical protein